MKKLFAILLCVTMLMSSAGVYAALPGQMKKIPLNYSSDMTFEMSLENADELMDFLLSIDETGAEESGMFDFRTLLGSLFDVSGKAVVKGNISDDYKKIQLFMSGEADYNVNLNSNLEIRVTPHTGIWIDMDISNTENPVMDIMLLTPASSRYYEINVFEILPEEEKADLVTFLNLIFCEQFMEGIAANSMNIMEKYAEVRTKGSECTMILDNDSVIAMYSELFTSFSSAFAPLAGMLADYEGEPDIIVELPDMTGLEILGENGITMKYVLDKDTIQQGSIDIDVDINVSAIYTFITGDEWEYENDITVGFNVTTDVKYYDYGRTSVKFPDLTAQNSINVAEMFLLDNPPDGFPYVLIPGYGDYFYDYSEGYPLDWFNLKSSYIPVIDSVVYLPFREVLTTVYGDTTAITVDNGIVTAVCKDHNKDITVSIAEGSNKAYLDGVEYEIGGVVVIDGVEYIDSGFFENVMGWSINYAEYNVITGEYYISGSTYDWGYSEDTYEEVYPRMYVMEYSDYLPFAEGQVYLPLRALLEGAYGDSLTLDYNNGKITAKSQYFPGFTGLVLNEGDSKVYADSEVFETGACFIENGITYVHPEIFTELFGWELNHITKDILSGVYEFSYNTYSY